MKHNSLIHVIVPSILATLFFTCKSEKTDRSPFSPDNIKSEFFKVKAGEAGTFKTRQGVVIEVSAQTFYRREPNSIVTLEVKTAIGKEDMVLGGLSTVDSSGQILESAGMVFIDAQPRQPINPDFPIRVKIPAQDANPGMKIFRLLDKNNPSGGWVETGQSIQIIDLPYFQNGEGLFKVHCASCHSTNLRNKLTGPALGNVQLFRSREWLRDFTRNSQKMIASGDRTAECLWNMWKPVMMSDFEKLSDEEIDAIYDWIGMESLIQRIKTEEIYYIADCDLTQSHAGLSVALPISPDSALIPIVKYYESEFRDFGWVNVDALPDATDEVEPFEITLDQPELAGWLDVIVVFRQRKIVVKASPDEMNVYRMTGSINKAKVRLPPGDTVEIFGTGVDFQGRCWFGKMDAVIGKTNRFTLETGRSDCDELFRYVKVSNGMK